LKDHNAWKEKVYNTSCKKGTIFISGCPRFASWEIYVDDFVYTRTKPGERTFSFQLPLGRYRISFATNGLDTVTVDGTVIVADSKSNEVEVELSDYTPQIKLIGKRGLISLKLKSTII
jgi:outer membrane protein assembly factor BamB